MQQYKLLSAIIIFTLFACGNQKKDLIQNQEELSKQRIIESYPKHAKGFKINYYDEYKILEVINPWDSSLVMYRYVLVSNKSEYIPDIPQSVIIRTPINSMACLFTTQIGFASKLGVLDKLTGMSRIKYVKDSVIRAKIEKGDILLFGEPENPNIEKLIALDPDILMVSPFRENKYQQIENAGIPLAVNGSYMESTPLGRAEWIKFMAYFFEKEEEANLIFDDMERKYLDIKEKVENIPYRPEIFLGKKFNQVWHIAGGKSYMAEYLNDAGFNYLWKDLDASGSLPFEFETVYQKAAHANYWAFVEYQETEFTYLDLKKSFPPYADFDAFKNNQIIICNSNHSNYFETGILEPHIILADFVKIAHPDVVPNHIPQYFKLMKPNKY